VDFAGARVYLYLVMSGERVRVESITIAGFRCFGPQPTAVPLSPDITAVVGPNAAGKTALLHALAKLFGVTRAQRTVLRSDFHVGASDDPSGRESKSMFIEAWIRLPELVDGDATPETVAPSFRHMQLQREGEAPVCRVRLDARWVDDGTAEGDVSQELNWVDALESDPPPDKRHPITAADRGLIQLYYTPAARDAAAQVRASSGALAARLLRAIEWSEETEGAVEEASKNLTDAFEGEGAIGQISEALKTRWSDLHDEVVHSEPRLSLVSRRFEEVVSKVAVMFEDGPDGRQRGLEALSDGQQSLFYFALAAAVFDLERHVIAGEVDGFLSDHLRTPALTIFAVEEPENHLSPYFLSRIIRQVRSLTATGSAQAIITSHSPAVLSRVEPHEVRYCRQGTDTRVSSVRSVRLPDGSGEAAKFVRGAMLAFPELYFARFVLLVEGDSERVVLPHLAEALDVLVDPAFVAIVPLGGRHVQYFWRLLTDLGIPHATLLDLDLGREGGGFGRIKTAIQNLLDIGVPREALLTLQTGSVMSDLDFQLMHTWQGSDQLQFLDSWIGCLNAHSVFFSTPLDLDLAMLRAFPDAYHAIIPKGGGPKLAVEKAAEAVLGTTGPGLALYGDSYKGYRDLLSAYRYHFLTHSKPATHLAALTHVDRVALRKDMPTVLNQVLRHIAKNVRKD
jgi:putative ATP-dependent endonuclease of OLD family